jgi:hypothetical protein
MVFSKKRKPFLRKKEKYSSRLSSRLVIQMSREKRPGSLSLILKAGWKDADIVTMTGP